MRTKAAVSVCISLFFALTLFASNPNGSDSAVNAANSVSFPHVIRFTGSLVPGADIVGVTFSLYKEQTGGTPLWQEVQNVRPDASGHYSVLLGSTQTEGLPSEAFTANEARWIGVRVEGGAEQARILLVSVPYALKAGDAETLGGMPASAFALNPAVAGGAAGARNPLNQSTPKSYVTTRFSGKTAAANVITANFLPMFADGAGNLTNSLVFQGTNGVVGVNTNAPSNASNAKLHVNGNILLKGQTTHQVQLVGTASSGRLGQDVSGFFFASDTANKSIRFLTTPQGGTLTAQVYIQPNGNVGIGSATASSRLTVAGDITSSSNVTGNILNAATGFALSGVPVVSASSTYGNLFVGQGVGTATTPITPPAGCPDNNNGNPNTCTGDYNAFFGVQAGAANTTGNDNTFAGFDAGLANTTGFRNTFVGQSAGYSNTSGDRNTFLGNNAGGLNTTGEFNTFVGNFAGAYSLTGGFNSTLGARSGQSNTTGFENVFSGFQAGYFNSTGYDNTFIGTSAGLNNTTGYYNTYLGNVAGNSNNGNYNVYVGFEAGYTPTADNNTMRLGSVEGDGSAIASTYIAGINGSTVTNGMPVYIDSTGKLGTLGGNNAVFGGVVSANSFEIGGTPVLGASGTNIFVGQGAGNGASGFGNTFVGNGAGVTNGGGYENVYIGDNVGSPSGGWNIYLGAQLNTNNTENDTMRLGNPTWTYNTYISGINGAPTASGVPVLIDASGKLGTTGGGEASFGGAVSATSYQINNSNVLVATPYTKPPAGGNVFVGLSAGAANSTGSANTFSGYQAGAANTSGQENTFAGYQSGSLNDVGYQNTFTGYQSGLNNTGGFGNSFTGYQAGLSNSTGSNNTFNGVAAGYINTTGSANLFEGSQAGSSNNAGNDNVYLGPSAGQMNSNGSYNVYLGALAGFTISSESNTMRLGSTLAGGSAIANTYIAGITGVQVSNGVGVVVDSNGHVGVAASSSRRFKDDIRPMGDTTDGLFKLRPVTFFYKRDFEPGSRRLLQYGLVAEELAEVYPELVTYDAEGRPNAIKYQYFTPMLLNELQKQHKVITQQQSVIEAQEDRAQTQDRRIADLEKRLARMEALLEHGQN